MITFRLSFIVIKSRQELLCLIRVNYIDQAIPTTISRKPNTYRITWIETWTKKLVEPNDRNTNSWREMAWNAEGVTTKEMNMKKDGEREMDIYLVVAENWAAWDKGAVHPCPRVQARAQKLYPSQSLVGGHPSRPRPLLCSLHHTSLPPSRFSSSQKPLSLSFNGPLQFALRPTAHSRRIN